MTKTLWIIRGVSGSGKTDLANTLASQLPNTRTVAADDYFLKDSLYLFDASRLHRAHEWCKDHVDSSMRMGFNNVIVHNTFVRERDIKPYTDLADSYGYKVRSLVVENRHGNGSIHDVPDTNLVVQERRLRNNLKLR